MNLRNIKKENFIMKKKYFLKYGTNKSLRFATFLGNFRKLSTKLENSSNRYGLLKILA